MLQQIHQILKRLSAVIWCQIKTQVKVVHWCIVSLRDKLRNIITVDNAVQGFVVRLHLSDGEINAFNKALRKSTVCLEEHVHIIQSSGMHFLWPIRALTNQSSQGKFALHTCYLMQSRHYMTRQKGPLDTNGY